MNRNREGYKVSKTHRECTSCGSIFKKTNSMTLCLSCNSTRVKSQTPEWKMCQRAKQRAKYKNREFSLVVEDIYIPEICPILKIPLIAHKGRSGAYQDSPSLDRKDNSKGYTKDNIWVISQKANAMKCHATREELILFSQWINKELR